MSLFKMVEKERNLILGVSNYGDRRYYKLTRHYANKVPLMEAWRLSQSITKQGYTNSADKNEIVNYWLTHDTDSEMGTLILGINDARKACSHIDDGRMWGDTKKSNPTWYQEITVK